MSLLQQKQTPAWKSLKPGDPWTFILDRPFAAAVDIGDHILWTFPGDARTYVFRVRELHEPWTYLCVFIRLDDPPEAVAAAVAPRPLAPWDAVA